MATYDDYIKKLGGKRVSAGEDWKDVHQQVVADYAARNPEAPMPQASGGGEIGGVQQPATPQAAPQLGILPQAPSATTSAAVPGMNVPTPGGIKGALPSTVNYGNEGKNAAPPPKPMGWNDVPPLRAPDGAKSIYADWGGTAAAPAPQQASYSNEGRNIAAPAAQQPSTASGLNAPWWSPSYAAAANASDKSGLELERDRAAAGAKDPSLANDPAKRMLTTGTFSTGAGISPANQIPANPINPKDASYRMEGSNYKTPIVSAPAASPTAPVISPQGKVTSLGAGTDVGFGATRFDIPGKSPLFTDKAGASGMADNMSLLNRGPVSAQNQAAMDNLLARSANDVSRQVAALQFKDQVAQAQAINDANARLNPPNQYNPLDLRDPTNIARRNFETSLSRRPNESAADYKVRADAMLNANSNFNTNTANTNSQQLAAQRLAAETANAGVLTGQAQQRLGIDGRRADTDAARVGNEVATGDLTRAEKAIVIANAQQMADLQRKYMASGDPKEKASLAKSIRDLNGKQEQQDWSVHVTPTTKNADGSTSEGSVWKVNKTTGEVQEVTKQAQGKPVPASFAEYEKAVRAANPNMKLDTAVLKAKHAQLLGAQK